MWSFWTRRKQKAQIRATFGEFLSEQALREIENPPDRWLQPEKQTIGYVILQVRGDTPEDIQSNLAQTIEAIIDNEGIIEGTISSIFMVAFKAAPSAHMRSVQTLRDRLGSTVRAVYGYGEFARGAYGSSRSFGFATVLPDISAKLAALLQLEFGAWKEA